MAENGREKIPGENDANPLKGKWWIGAGIAALVVWSVLYFIANEWVSIIVLLIAATWLLRKAKKG